MKTTLLTIGLAAYLVALWSIDSKGMTDTKAMQLEADYKDIAGALYAGR